MQNAKKGKKTGSKPTSTRGRTVTTRATTPAKPSEQSEKPSSPSPSSSKSGTPSTSTRTRTSSSNSLTSPENMVTPSSSQVSMSTSPTVVEPRSSMTSLELESALPGGSAPKRRRKGLHPVHKMVVFHSNVNESWCTISDCTHRVPGNHSGNKMNHLKHYHKEAFEELEKEWTGASASSKVKKQPPTRQRVLNGVKMSGPELELLSVRLITECRLPFQVLDYAPVKALIQPYVDCMPASDRPTISSHTTPLKIHGLAERVRKKLAEEMEGRMLSVKADGCTRRTRHFVGLNVQYIKDGKMTVRTLVVEEMTTGSTAENLKELAKRTLRRYGSSPKYVVTFTSDNGENYVLSGHLLNKDAAAAAAANADADTVLSSDSDAEEADTSDEEPDGLQQDLRQVEGDLEGNGDDWLDVDLDVGDGVVIQSVRCVVHTLQCAINDAFKDVAECKPLLEDVRKFVKFLRNETNIRQIREAKKSLPVLDVCSRWSSTHGMCQSAVALRHFAEITLLGVSKKARADNFLTSSQWEEVEDLIADLEPLKKATVKLQAEDLTLGKTLAIWLEARYELEARKTPLADSVLKHMEERCKSVRYKRGGGERRSALFDYPAFFASVFADPRYIALLEDEQISTAKTYLVTLWQRMQVLRGDNPSPPEPESDDSDRADEVEEDAGPFAMYLKRRNKARQQRNCRARAGPGASSSSGRSKLQSELDEYDRQIDSVPPSQDPLHFWELKKYEWPILTELAKVVLAIPATQVSVERLFSALKFLLRPDRFNLSAQLVDDVCFLHANADLLQEVGVECLKELLDELVEQVDS